MLVSHLNKGTNSSGSSVEDSDSIFFDHIPQTTGIGRTGSPFVHQASSTIGQWTIDNITVSRNPADISSTPVDISLLEVKGPLGSHVGVEVIATSSVNDPFRFTGGTTSVENEEHIFTIHGFRWTISRCSRLQVMPPVVSSWFHVNPLLGAFYH